MNQSNKINSTNSKNFLESLDLAYIPSLLKKKMLYNIIHYQQPKTYQNSL